MSRAYSNHFNSNATPGVATALTDTIPYSVTRRPPAGIAHARARVKVARAVVPTAGMTSGDELRMMRFKSGDRLWKLSWSSAGASTTYAADLGIYLAGSNGTGAVVDVDLFGGAKALANDTALTETFGGGALEDEDRGKALWELASEGASLSLTADPMVEYDIVFTSTATGTGAVEDVLLVAEYTSGD